MIKEDPDCEGKKSPDEAAPTPVQIKEEPKEIQIKEESIQVFPVIVSVRSEKEESLLPETVKEEKREDGDGAEAENSSDTDDSADWTPSAESPTPQTHTEQLQELAHGNNVSGDRGSDKPHKCSDCGKGFSTRYDFKMHVWTHTGEKPFKCPECASTFSKKYHLKTHMMKHSGDMPYRCPDCDKAFAQMSDMKKHIRCHTGEKPFGCTVCAKSFSQSSSLNVHMRSHTGEKPFRCPECALTFHKNVI
uniref:C2H2-type domain-containing protein n=1 Tax=Neogobius melanostomus TaxID=47308 RepID=A0A8C6S9B4_9GOBI